MKSKRRNHSGQFKVKVALAAARGDKTIAELASDFGVHPTQVTQWKKQLLAGTEDMFSTTAERKAAQPGPSVKELQAKIGQLTMEVDFLGGALDRMGDPRGRR